MEFINGFAKTEIFTMLLQRKNIEFYKNIRSLRERKFLLESQSTSSLFIETSVVDENTQEEDGILEVDNDDSVEEMVDDKVVTNEEEKSIEPSVLQIYKHDDLFKKILPKFDIIKGNSKIRTKFKIRKICGGRRCLTSFKFIDNKESIFARAQ